MKKSPSKPRQKPRAKKESAEEQRAKENAARRRARIALARRVHATGAQAFCVEVFALRNGISRSQTFLEIKAGRLVARKSGRLTLITIEAEKAWRDGLPRVVPRDAEASRQHEHDSIRRRGG